EPTWWRPRSRRSRSTRRRSCQRRPRVCNQAIDGVVIRPLAIIADDRGAVLRMLRADDPHFVRFGEIYFSLVNPAAVKAWRRHRDLVLHYAVPRGHVRVVVFDDRPASPTTAPVMELETCA